MRSISRAEELAAPAPRALAATPAAATMASRDAAMGALRSFVTLLVLAHHAVLAYHPFAPPPPASLDAPMAFWKAFPVVDPARWSGFAWFVGWNDGFFMSLMFFLSGLFVWQSLRRKGSGRFLRDRGLRLGLPFLVAAAVIAPLAYYPTYLQTGADPSLAGFLRQWLAIGDWPAGPAWFIWVLLAFDAIAAGLYALLPGWGDALARLLGGAFRRPLAAFALVVGVSAIAYVPMARAVSPMDWASFGPFFFQTGRIVHYAAYFFIGVVVGAVGIERGFLAAGGRLARRWPLWVVLAAVAFLGSAESYLRAMTSDPSSRWATIASLAFVVSCAASSFAFLALFARFAQKRSALADSLAANAYGMYLVHYAFVAWLQYALLGASLSGLTKGLLVTAGTIALTWLTVAALRRAARAVPARGGS